MTHATDQTWYPRLVVKARRANAPLPTEDSAAASDERHDTENAAPGTPRDATARPGTQRYATPRAMMRTMERPATSSRTLIQVPVHNFRDLFLGHSPYDLIGYLSALEDK
jgi:hypothetical protein